MKALAWNVYIILADDNSLYTGITTNVERRWEEHCQRYYEKGKKGAKYFSGRCPQEIVLVENHPTRSEASQREAQIKKMKKSEKLSLIKANKAC